MLTDADKGFIINYILINNNWLRIRSRGLYHELERTPQLSHHRWQNMRAFMVFTLKNEINKNPMYNALDEDDKDKLLHGSKSKAAAKISSNDRLLLTKQEPKSSYTEQDDIDIINFMLQDDHHQNIKKTCEQMAGSKFNNTKTASSLRERFMRRIRMKLDTYPFLNEAQRSVLRGPIRTSPFDSATTTTKSDGSRSKRRGKAGANDTTKHTNSRRKQIAKNSTQGNRNSTNRSHAPASSNRSATTNRSRRKPENHHSTTSTHFADSSPTGSQLLLTAQQQQAAIAAGIASRTRHGSRSLPTQAPHMPIPNATNLMWPQPQQQGGAVPMGRTMYDTTMFENF